MVTNGYIKENIMGYFPRLETPMVADVVTPIVEGFAERRRRKLEDVQEGRTERAEQRTIADRLYKAENDKHDRERQERQDSIEEKEKRLQLDKDYLDWGRNLLSTSNPDELDDEKFNAQVSGLGAQYERGLVEKYGHTPEEAEQKMNNLFMAGNFSREGIKQMQIKMELRKDETKDSKAYSPSPIMKMYNEVNELIGEGVSQDSDIVKALQAKISGQEVDPTTLTDDAVDMLGTMYSYTGKLPSLGRGKAATAMRARIYTRAAEMSKESLGVQDAKPTDIGLKVLAESSDTKAIQGSLNMLDKQINSMESFAVNLDKQVERVKEKTKGLKTYDTRFLNVPLRTFRGKVTGSPEQAIYDMYVTEIEAEIGKIATGSTQSIAELSTSAQEKWAKIHDKNLSWNDMVQLLDESSHAAKMRVASVKSQQQVAKDRMARKGEGGEPTSINSQEEFDNLPSGATYIDTEDGKTYRKP